MSKISIVAAVALAVSSTMFATDVKPFAGLELGMSQVGSRLTLSYDLNSVSVNTTHSGAALGIRGGAIIGDTHRIALGLSKIDYAKKENVDPEAVTIVASYDYLYGLARRSKLFCGVHLGSAAYKLKISGSGGDSETLKPSGAMFGAQIGYIYKLNGNFEFEAGLKYTVNNAKKDKSDVDEDGDRYKLEQKTKDSVQVGIALNYKF